MVLFNYSTKEITAKIVYYGPGLCGKTTNLQFVYDALPSNAKSKMLSLATKADRTLFFDFLPIDLGRIRGMRTRVQLYTVPGQVYYNSTRQLVLKGADGVVFVADSQKDLVDANLESWGNLKDNLKKQGVDYRKLPIVIQYNKRDLPGVLSIEAIDPQINELNAPFYESVATSGIGVEDTLKGIVRLVLKDLMGRYGLSGDVSEDEISLGARTTSEPKSSGAETIWAEENARGEVDDLQDVPFLVPEAPGAAPKGTHMEVVELREGDSDGFVDGQVEMLDGEAPPFPVTPPPALEDGDDIVFDTLPDSAVVAAPPKPLAADSLVVALGGAADRKPPQAPGTAPMLPLPVPPHVAAPASPEPLVTPAAAVPSPSPAPIVPPAPPAPTAPPVRPTAPPLAPAAAPPAPRPSLSVARPSMASPVTTPADPSILLKEVTLPLNLALDEIAGKKRIVVKIQLEVNILR
jgi:signal recognition particle receptor subunit beta